ncbi:LysR family transcriptional regulator [Pokkaliibacter plantistimulans]|uniref:LysR family transcriptional regulator n=1 Tax=Proteobacteria bacterium 228 TaxID=2083153 RepID=A0A2S5KID3_9PROT|nr:LysR family transcriptional regulator [Pokkaliibacter plantistimulans]
MTQAIRALARTCTGSCTRNSSARNSSARNSNADQAGTGSALLTVREELNFNRAAERLHITQPALSRQIQQLEGSIPAVLFERSSKRVDLTEAGRNFYHHALRIVSELQAAARESRLLSQGQQGTLAIGIFGSSILDLVPQVLKQFSARYPDVNVALHPMDKDMQIQALRERRLTVGFNRLVPAEPDIEQEYVRTEPLMVAMADTHPLADAASIRMEEILQQPLILYPRGVRRSLVMQVFKLFDEYNATPVVAQEVTDVTTAVALVAGGLGITILPRAASNLRLPGVIYKPLISRGAAINSSIELICMYRRGDTSPILNGFLQILRTFSDK